ILLLIGLVIILPLLIVGGAEVLKRYIGFREKKLELEIRDKTVEAETYRAELEGLKHRTQVLERIATDKGVMLADEIEALRDKEVRLEDRRNAKSD
ncbi:MAG TPA: hypothetical protein VLA37_04725, partial [Sphingomonadaceae bacterium]|nr:hypothetical protein [Sphingomonadaceae bacterium]